MAKDTQGTKSAARNRNAVSVVQQVTTVVQNGRDNYVLQATADGKGVAITSGETSLVIPFGDAGKAILDALAPQIQAKAPRRTRRTKAQIEADKASSAPQS